MTTIAYPKFTVKTEIKLPINTINDINGSIRIVVSPKNCIIIYEGELSLVNTTNILSGDEEKCLKALQDILDARKYKYERLKSIL